MPEAQAIIAQGPDGDPMRHRVEELIRSVNHGIQIGVDRAVPDTWDNALILFLATPGAFADKSLIPFVNAVVAAKLPLLPVVDDLSRFDFRSVPSDFATVSDRNAKGLQPDDGKGLLAAVLENLGFESKNRMRQVFISYRRSDGEQAAQQIEAHLWTQRCAAFLDTIQLEGAAPVQKDIMKALRDKDFVLFIDSPDAANSNWVIAELNTALQLRIPVAVVRTDPPQQHITLLGSAPAVDWDPTDNRRLEKVFRLVSRGIGSRSTLDDRMQRTLALISQTQRFELKVEISDNRRYTLERPDRVIRIEYEDAGVTLERLHRLYLWYASPPPCFQAIFVCGDYLVLPPTRDALAWASQKYPLVVMTLREMVTLLKSL